MPLFEYVCPSCDERFELLIRGSEKPRCPDCGSGGLDQQMSVPAAHVSGSSLPICQAPPQGGCGAPQCGQGGCGM